MRGRPGARSKKIELFEIVQCLPGRRKKVTLGESKACHLQTRNDSTPGSTGNYEGKGGNPHN
jgi:hypothetical protein